MANRKSALVPEPYASQLCSLSKMDLVEIAWTMAFHDKSDPNTDAGLYRKLLLAREELIGRDIQRRSQRLTLALWRPLSRETAPDP